MKVFEILNEQMPGNKEIAQMKQDSVDLQNMAASGQYDPNLTMNAMQRMATTAAKADIGSQMLKFFQTFATAIKQGIDNGVYGNRVGEMQKAYDQIMAEMPKLKQMAADSKAMAAKYGTPTGNLTKDGTYKGTNITPTKMQKDRMAGQTNETASGMGASSVATVVGNVGRTQSRNMYNADGTMKNGLEYGNLLGGKKKSKKKKQA